jgi:UDP-galactopyranose mutase
MTSYDFLIVGAGFAGSVCAQQLSQAGKKILLIDKRPHIGGNAYDRVDEHGILIHPYGPHIFHTNSKRVFEYLSLFTDWRFYEHRVLAEVKNQLLPIPINRTTINKLYDLNLDEDGVSSFLDSVRIHKPNVESSEDVVLSSVGAELCELFFRGYTRKQWGLDLSELSAGVAARIPTRTNDDDRYFTDSFQFMPAQGYTCMFNNMLDSSNITIKLDTDFETIKNTEVYKELIYTGPIDEYFGYRLGKLPYRSLRFEHQHLDENQIQSVGTVNYPNSNDFTRITEFKHLTGSSGRGTSIVKEYPTDEGDPYYPIPQKQNEALYKQYENLADNEKDVYFVGRLAQYRYYNMDQVVAAALTLSNKILHSA